MARLESQVRSLEVSVATMGHFIASLAETNSNVEIPGEIRRVVTQLSVAERRSSSASQSLLKSPKQGTALQKAMPLKINEETSQCIITNVRTNSVGSEISTKVQGSEEKPREMPYPLKSTLSSPNLTTKLSGMSSFFASTHNQIKQQKLNVTDSLTEVTHSDNNSAGANSTKHVPLADVACYEKSSSVPLAAAHAKLKSSQSSFELGSGSNKNIVIGSSQCDSSESGNVTLTSPTGANHIHPLDTCSDVHFTYGGTTKLKTLRPLRAQLSRNPSVDSIQILKSVGPGGDVKVLASEVIDSKKTDTSTVASICETKKNLITG
jgi:TBC1 domain-containing protein 4